MMFSAVRAQLKFKISTAQGKKGKFPVLTDKKGEIEKVLVPIDEYPMVLALPVFRPPTLLTVNPKTDTSTQIRLMRFGFGSDFKSKLAKIKNETGADRLKSLPFQLPLDAFGRMLAKISHCFAVGKLGINDFVPMLPDVILKNADQLDRFVGNTGFMLEMGTRPGHHHQIHLATVKHPEFENELLVAFVRLFCVDATVPFYSVVVGECGPTTKRRLLSTDFPAGT